MFVRSCVESWIMKKRPSSQAKAKLSSQVKRIKQQPRLPSGVRWKSRCNPVGEDSGQNEKARPANQNEHPELINTDGRNDRQPSRPRLLPVTLNSRSLKQSNNGRRVSGWKCKRTSAVKVQTISNVDKVHNLVLCVQSNLHGGVWFAHRMTLNAARRQRQVRLSTASSVSLLPSLCSNFTKRRAWLALFQERTSAPGLALCSCTMWLFVLVPVLPHVPSFASRDSSALWRVEWPRMSSFLSFVKIFFAKLSNPFISAFSSHFQNPGHRSI